MKKSMPKNKCIVLYFTTLNYCYHEVMRQKIIIEIAIDWASHAPHPWSQATVSSSYVTNVGRSLTSNLTLISSTSVIRNYNTTPLNCVVFLSGTTNYEEINIYSQVFLYVSPVLLFVSSLCVIVTGSALKSSVLHSREKVFLRLEVCEEFQLFGSQWFVSWVLGC